MTTPHPNPRQCIRAAAELDRYDLNQHRPPTTGPRRMGWSVDEKTTRRLKALTLQPLPWHRRLLRWLERKRHGTG